MGDTDPVINVLNTILGEVSHLRSDLDALRPMREMVEAHIKDEEEFKKVAMAQLTSAFPEGNPTLHRLDHEARIERARFYRQFWRARIEQIGSGSFWAILSALVAVFVFWWNGHMPDALQVKFPQ